jgi:hypothetical protein
MCALVRVGDVEWVMKPIVRRPKPHRNKLMPKNEVAAEGW